MDVRAREMQSIVDKVTKEEIEKSITRLVLKVKKLQVLS